MQFLCRQVSTIPVETAHIPAESIFHFHPWRNTSIANKFQEMGDFLKQVQQGGGGQSSREKINVMVYYPQKIPPVHSRNSSFLVSNVLMLVGSSRDHWQNACYKSFWWIIPKVQYCFSQTALLFSFSQQKLTINIFTDYFRRQHCKCFSPVCSILDSTRMFNYGNFFPHCKNTVLSICLFFAFPFKFFSSTSPSALLN